MIACHDGIVVVFGWTTLMQGLRLTPILPSHSRWLTISLSPSELETGEGTA